MYATNALKKKWMDHVRVIFWDPSQRTPVENQDVQEKLKAFQSEGGEAWVCKACADDLGTGEHLARLGVKVESAGAMLTGMLKDGWHQLTF